jgi:hypothetical protein
MFNIDCGETTCAVRPGYFCSLLRTNMRGEGFCFLFGKLWEKDGWLQRHKSCLALANTDKSILDEVVDMK